MADLGEQDNTKRRSCLLALTTSSASPLHEQNEQSISITTSWKSLFRFTTLIHLPLLIVSIVVTIVAGVVRVIFALYLGKLFGVLSQFGIGTLAGSQLLDRTRDYTFIILTLGGISWVSSSGFYFLWTVFGELQTQRAGHSLFRELLIRDFVWFDTRKDGIGALLSHLQKQLRELQIATNQPLGQFILHLSRVLSGIILAFTISWSVTLVTMAGIPISFLVIYLTSKRMSPILKAQQCELSEASKTSYDAFAFIDVVKCLNGQFSTYTRMMTRIRAAASLYMKMAVLNSVQTAFPRFMSLIMFVQGFWFGSVQVQKGKLKPGDVLTTFWACMIVTQSVSSIVYFSAALIRGEIAGETLHHYINAHDKTHSQSKINGGRRPNLYAENIILKRVAFAYPSRPDQLILRELDMEFPAGKTTFIVGQSGAGKSTLINLLLKFFTPSSGGILVGDTPYQMIDPTWIRRNVTLVQQNNFLFNESLFNNIAYGTRHPAFVTREQIDLCIELANLTSTVQSLPSRLQTIVGFGGSLLSGGQKQRVALARARMKNSPVLILDEFTSALDHDNCATVMEAVRKWRHGMTTIIVTHDTSNILADDFMYVIEAGTVAASGFKRDLIKGSQSAIFAQATADLPPSKAPWNDDRGYEMGSMDDFEHSWFDDTSSELWSPLSESTSLMKQTFTTKFDKAYAEDIVQFSPPPQIALRVMTPLGHRSRPAINSELSFCNLDDDDDNQYLPSPTRIDSLFTRSGRYRKHKQKNTTKSINITLPLHKTFMTIPSTLSKRQRILLAGAATLAAIHAGSTPIFSYLLSHLFDSFYAVDKSKASSIAKKYSVAIVGLAAIDSIIFFSMYYIFEYCSQAWMDRLRGQSIRRILSQPCSWFEKGENGPLQLTICVDQHAEEIRNLAGKFGGFLMIGIMTAFIAVVWSFLLKWQLTFVSLSCVPIWYGVSTGLRMVNTKWEKKLNDLNEDMANVFSEAFTDIATVRAFTMENHFTIKISQVLQRKLSVAAKRGIYTGVFSGLAESVIIFASALLIYYAAVLAAPDAMGISNIVSVLTMILFSLAHVVWMMSWIPQLNAANDTATRLIKLSQLPEGSSSSHEMRGNLRVFQPVPIVFNDLSFYYPSRPEAPALRNFSCVIPENKCTAIVGSSGSGKSTIVSLLLKLYACPEPSFGDDSTPAISLGGVDIRQVHTSTLRNLIGYVPQQPRLFADTVRANITYGLDPCSRFNSLKNIEAAATAAGIADLVRSLPEGYSTVVGEGGLKLSGGQAQRLVIARALVRHPRVLILDEATSSLDAENADLIRTSVKRLLATQAQGLTVIMVTHSRDMMEMADNVIVMDNGKAVEQGTLMALLKRSDGRLREMVNS